MTSNKRVNSGLLAALQQKLENAELEERKSPTVDTETPRVRKAQRKLNNININESTDSIVKSIKGVYAEQNKKVDDSSTDAEKTHQGGLYGLLEYFEQRLKSPEYSDDTTYLKKKRMYEIFEDSLYKSLKHTRDTGEYDDFAELTVLYFIATADQEGFSVEDIESLMEEIS